MRQIIRSWAFARAQKKEKARVLFTKKAESAIPNSLSNASDKKRVEIAMELLKHWDPVIRTAVASVTARLGIKALGVWFELVNRLADEHPEVRLEAAKAFWQLKGVDYAIRSLLDEFNAPAHMSKEDALGGIDALRQVSSDKSTLEKLLEENWEDYPARYECTGRPRSKENGQKSK